MANPQLEDGFLQIANEVWEHLTAIRIPGRARQVLDFIIRKTWGFSKKEDKIPLSQFVEATGICMRHLHREFAILQRMNLITKIGDNNNVTYSFNKDYETWKPSPKKVTSPIKVIKITKIGDKDHLYRCKSSPIKADSKDTLKDTSTKDTLKDISSPKKSGDHEKAIKYWCSKYLDRFQIKYNFQTGKDGATVKRLLSAFGFEVYCQLVDQIFLSDDPFYRTGGGLTITVLQANSNKLAQEIARQDSPLDKLSEKGRETLMAGARVLKKLEEEDERKKA